MEKKELQEVVNRYLESKGLPIHIALAFEDVYLINRTSRVKKRSDIDDFSTCLARDIYLNIPFVSANMVDVTEAKMAIAIARLGGLGFIHQLAPIERRIEEVGRVKRADNEVIENPWTVQYDAPLEMALALMREEQISGVLVTDSDGKLVGILTKHDVNLRLDRLAATPRVRDIMTPDPITESPDVSIENAKRILGENRIEKLPLVDSVGRPVGLITARDISKKLQYPKAVRDTKGRLRVGAAVGISRDYIKETARLLEAGADVILVDAPNTNTLRAAKVIRDLRGEFPELPLVAGNVDNAEGTLLLIDAGADCVKEGIGGGSACDTRIVTGFGAPQMRAIPECVSVASVHGIPVMADGGFDDGHKIAKGLAAGASTIMLGGLFSAAEETPGEIITGTGGKRFKRYRGSAGIEIQAERVDWGTLDRIRTPEGETRMVPYEGKTVGEVIGALLGGLSSSMGFGDAFSLEELREIKFRWQTSEAFKEGEPKE